jgi:ligand-binding sensor protein
MIDVYRIKSREEWQQILDNLFEELELPAALMDGENTVLQTSGERNPLCATIRERKGSLSFICGQTQQFLSEQARMTKKPVIEMCEAGLVKLVVPVFWNGVCAGNVTACGAVCPEEEIETFLIGQSTNASEEDIDALCKEVPEIEREKVVQAAFRLFQKIERDTG